MERLMSMGVITVGIICIHNRLKQRSYLVAAMVTATA